MFPGRTILLLTLLTCSALFYGLMALLSGTEVARHGELATPASAVTASSAADRISQLDDSRIAAVTGNRRSDLFPEVLLTDQSGRVRRFRSDIVRDNIVCLVFFYTECQGTCPGTTQMMKRLRESLNDDFAGEPVKFVSISLDPENDKPEDLLSYAQQNGISTDDKMSEWIFCTGTLADIEEIRVSLGLYDLDPVVDADRTQHAALLVFGNDQLDRWATLPAGLNFSDLSETFRRIVGTTQRQRFETRIARSAVLVHAQQTSSTESCCNKPSANGINACCRKPTE